jgi:hypothetical protein
MYGPQNIKKRRYLLRGASLKTRVYCLLLEKKQVSLYSVLFVWSLGRVVNRLFGIFLTSHAPRCSSDISYCHARSCNMSIPHTTLRSNCLLPFCVYCRPSYERSCYVQMSEITNEIGWVRNCGQQWEYVKLAVLTVN